MSLLDRADEDVMVYPEEVTVDAHGNTLTMASETGFSAKADIQPAQMSGTSARRADQANEGFQTEQMYRLRFPRSFDMVLGAQARIGWRGDYWAIFGDPYLYSNIRGARHWVYTIARN